MSQQTKVKAATRDASWHPNPDTRWPKKYHLINAEEGHPRCGLQSLLSEESVMDAADVPVASRCTRSGCRQHWPEVSREPADEG